MFSKHQRCYFPQTLFTGENVAKKRCKPPQFLVVTRWFPVEETITTPLISLIMRHSMGELAVTYTTLRKELGMCRVMRIMQLVKILLSHKVSGTRFCEEFNSSA
jgi:hypothetical protein